MDMNIYENDFPVEKDINIPCSKQKEKGLEICTCNNGLETKIVSGRSRDALTNEKIIKVT